MYFVFASTSGGGVGSSLPRNEYEGWYDLLDGFTGLLGSSALSFALMFGAACVFEALVARPSGAGVGRISTGRIGPGCDFCAGPWCGPGEAAPLGPGLGAVPGVRATAAALVALGLGTPARGAGGSEAWAAGAALAWGAAVALATAADVGDARGNAGAGVIARAVGRTIGAGGFGDGRAEGADVGTGEGAALGGIFTATAIGAVVGTLTGAAGSS